MFILAMFRSRKALVMRRNSRSAQQMSEGILGVPEKPSAATSKAMRGNKPKGTVPEMAVRRLLHSMSYGYRLHRKDLPGKQDMAFTSRKAVIEVRGCFWHRHLNCRTDTTPKTRAEFWAGKFEANVARDARNMEALERLGWRVLVVWECEVADADLGERIRAFLDPA